MEFTIYSIGSAAYLEEILNAVAMISGSGDIESLAKIGLLAGVLLMGFQAVFNNTGIQFQKILVCAIMYLAMYGPSGRALVEDVYTGDVAVVDNVPLGPLAVGSMVSNIGYNITHLFEQSFSTPSMTNYGFADPLNTLVQVRLTAKNVFNLGSLTGSGNESLLASWANYMRECTLTGANNDDRAIARILKDKNAIAALQYDSSVYYTKIYDGSAEGVTVTCTQAYQQLTSDTTSKQDELLDDLSASWARPASTFKGPELESRLNSALYAIAGGAIDARAFAVTAALLPILEGAPGQRAISDMQGAAAIMMSQAAQQQATQWAAEGSMFTKYIRPFMTFFEGFIYAITPLMAFVIVLGGFGISLVSKYLMLLIWMILWMPVLSIVNLYTISTTKAKVEALIGANSFGMTGLSFEDMRAMLPVIEAQIGVAGMMAAAVPALCMFLVYGTSVAASGIASKLGGSDTINEKISSPDVVSPGAGLSMSSQVSNDSTRGSRQTGFDEMVGSMVTGSSLSSSVQSMGQKAKTDQAAFSSQLSAATQSAYSDGMSVQDATKIGEGIRGSTAFQNSASMQDAYKSVRAQTNTQEEADAILGATTMGATLKGSASFGGKGGKGGKGGGQDPASVGADIGVKRTTTDGNSTKDAVQTGKGQDKVAALQSQVSGALSKDNSFSLDKVFAENSALSKTITNSDSLTKAAQQSVQSTDSFQQAEAAMQSYGINTNTNGLAVAQQLQKNGGMGKLQDILNHTEDKNGVSLAERMRGDQATLSSGLPAESAYVAAGLKALADTGNIDKLFESGINPNSNEGIKGPEVGNLSSAFESRHNQNEALFSSKEGQITDATADARLEGGDAAAGQYNSGSEKAGIRNTANKFEVDKAAGEDARMELAQVGSGAKTLDQFRTLGSFSNALSTYVGSDKEERTEGYYRDFAFAQKSGLNDQQAGFYADSRMGDVETAGIDLFQNQMVSQGFTPEESVGMRIKLEEASKSDAPGSHMGQIAAANAGQKMIYVTGGNDGPSGNTSTSGTVDRTPNILSPTN